MIFTIDQVNWRFCDYTDDGSNYAAAPMYLMITRLDKTTNTDGSVTVTQSFVGGSATADQCTAHVTFRKGLEAGEYVVIYKADWQA